MSFCATERRLFFSTLAYLQFVEEQHQLRKYLRSKKKKRPRTTPGERRTRVPRGDAKSRNT